VTTVGGVSQATIAGGISQMTGVSQMGDTTIGSPSNIGGKNHFIMSQYSAEENNRLKRLEN
ncbi:hypothetical protein WUBG_03192, partial [Wuchereria bancrofti]